MQGEAGEQFPGESTRVLFLSPAPNYPRDSVRVLASHRSVLITGHITWQRVYPALPAPAEMHDSLSKKEGGYEADDESMLDRGGWGMVDELDDGLPRQNDVDLTLGVSPGRVFAGGRTSGTCRRRCWRRDSRDDGFI